MTRVAVPSSPLRDRSAIPIAFDFGDLFPFT